MSKILLHSIRKSLTILLMLIFTSMNSVFAEPLQAKLYTNTLDAKVGDVINLRLKVNPITGNPIYTVSASLMFDPNLLEYKGSSLTESAFMLPVDQKPHILIDVVNGMIRRTAGYPTGVENLVDFATYKFEAIAPGDAKISIEDGLALDGLNENIGLQQKEMIIHIEESTNEDETATSSEYTYDMGIDILGPIAIYKEESYNFPISETIPGGSHLKFYVFDEKAKMYYSDEKMFESGQEVFFTIPANTLPEGTYVVTAETLDENGMTQVVTQRKIGVLSNGETWVSKNKDILYPIAIFILVISILHHLATDRDLYFKIKKLGKGKKANKNK